MITPANIRTRPWEWRADGIPPVNGLLISAGKRHQVFVPDTEIRTLADTLHDHADRLEATE